MSTTRVSVPGAQLLHPAVVMALAVLVWNDHWLKRTHPGIISGKLSDFAAALLVPLVVQASIELSVGWLSRRPPTVRVSNRALMAGVLAALVILALPEIWGPADTAYRMAGGALHYPLGCVWAWLRSSPLPSFQPAAATPDVTDLVALPMAGLAYFLGRRSDGRQGPAHQLPFKNSSTNPAVSSG